MDKPQTRSFAPSEQAVRSLIRRAGRHALGREFLLKGSLDAVAATFGVHAFTVEKAREALGDDGRALTPPRAKAKGA